VRKCRLREFSAWSAGFGAGAASEDYRCARVFLALAWVSAVPDAGVADGVLAGEKVGRNQERDRAAARALRRGGWRVFVVWECETAAKGLENLRRKLARFLSS
jgi:hypothetical protein